MRWFECLLYCDGKNDLTLLLLISRYALKSALQLSLPYSNGMAAPLETDVIPGQTVHIKFTAQTSNARGQVSVKIKLRDLLCGPVSRLLNVPPMPAIAALRVAKSLGCTV